jgi:streptogramin lyase
MLRKVSAPTGVSQLVATPRGLWATFWRAQAVARLDPRTGRVAGRLIQVPGTPATLAVGGGAIYVGLVAQPAGGIATIMKLDQKTGALMWSKQLQAQADRLVWLNGFLWAMVSTPNRLFRIDSTGVIRDGYDLPGGDADDLTVEDGRLWATVREPDYLVRIDPRTKRVADTYVGRSPTGVSVDGDDVWVGLWSSRRVVRVDAQTLKRRGPGVEVAINPFMLTADKSGVWVVCAGEGRVVRIRKL